MADAWGRGDRDGSDRTPLRDGEPGGHAADRAPGAAGAAAPAPPQPPEPPPGDARPAADQAADNQERMLESGEENAG